ncbi:MAG: VTT domain-containing protein [Patescibacteria group bacterium]
MEKFKDAYIKQRFWILLILIVLVLFLIFLPLLSYTPLSKIFTDPASIKEFILSYGRWAILIYVLLSVVVVIAPPIPNEIVPIVGGMAFGFWTALLFGLLARIIGSSINYFLGTKIRKVAYLKLAKEADKERLKKYTEKIGWQVVFISRFLPSADTDLIAYVAGITKMKYLPFIGASFLGMLVPVSVAIFVGASLLKSKYLFFILVAFYIIGMLFAPKIIKRVLKWKK